MLLTRHTSWIRIINLKEDEPVASIFKGEREPSLHHSRADQSDFFTHSLAR